MRVADGTPDPVTPVAPDARERSGAVAPVHRDVYPALVELLRNHAYVILVGGLLAVALSAVLANRVGGVAAFIGLAVLVTGLVPTVVVCFRIGAIGRGRLTEALARRFDGLYAIGAITAAAGMGIVVFTVLMARESSATDLVAAMLALGYVGATLGSGTNRYQAATVQAAAILMPLALALALRWQDPLNIGAALGSLSLILVMARVAARNNYTSVELLMAVRASRAMADRLTLQAQRFDAALENMPQGLSMVDRDGRLLVANPRFREMFGLSEQQVPVGSTWQQLLCQSMRSGNRSNEDIEAAGRRIVARLAAGTPDTEMIQARGGRLVQLRSVPMADGNWVLTYEDVTERDAANRALERLARIDSLTGLANRFAFGEALDAALAGPVDGCCVALAWLDLDRFKRINDALGHIAGDVLLSGVARQLRERFPRAVVARVGGDEFAIIVTLADNLGAAGLAAAMEPEHARPIRVGGQDIRPGWSVGIALVPADFGDAVTLMQRADLALQAAKRDGRGRVRRYDPTLGAAAAERAALERDLRDAVGADQFVLRYQPQVDLSDGRVVGAEALIRWRHPVRGELTPDLFVPLAEEAGLIAPIGAWVLDEACRVAAGWPAHLRISVNLSPVQFRDDQLVAHVAAALARHGLAPGRLELELTETALIDDAELAGRTLAALRALGVGLALDDFGIGWSSLSRLRLLPFNRIKIDRSFVADMEEDPTAFAIIKAVIVLGRELGIAVTAEGVEIESQRRSLIAQGCGEAQGFLWGPAVDGDRLIEVSVRTLALAAAA